MTFETFIRLLTPVMMLSLACGLIVGRRLTPPTIAEWLNVASPVKRYLNRTILAISCLLLPISIVWVGWTAAFNWWLQDLTPQAVLPYFMLSFLLVPPPLAYLVYKGLVRYGTKRAE